MTRPLASLEALFQSDFRYPKCREVAQVTSPPKNTIICDNEYEVTWCINEGMLTRPFGYVAPRRTACPGK